MIKELNTIDEVIELFEEFNDEFVRKITYSIKDSNEAINYVMEQFYIYLMANNYVLDKDELIKDSFNRISQLLSKRIKMHRVAEKLQAIEEDFV